MPIGYWRGTVAYFFTRVSYNPFSKDKSSAPRFLFFLQPFGADGNLNLINVMTNAPQKPNDYLVLSIPTTLLCCLPLGIVAIIRSCQVNSYWSEGKYEEAQKASAEAIKWSIIGIVCFATLVTLYVIILMLGVGVSLLG